MRYFLEALLLLGARLALVVFVCCGRLRLPFLR